MFTLHIGNFQDAERLLTESSNWAGVVSIGDPDQPPPSGLETCDRYLRREFHDVDARFRLPQSVLLARAEHVAAILEFFEATGDGPMLVHCSSGVSRSTACAFIGLCQAYGPGREREALEVVLAVRPRALPNRLIVELADEHLGRGGAMVSVVDEHRADWRREGIALAAVMKG